MNRSPLYAVIWTALAVFAWRAKVLIWVPLAGAAAYNLYRTFKPAQLTAGERPIVIAEDVPLGEFGRYTVDGTESLGLFIPLGGGKVFVDLREDEHIERRKAHAKFLFTNAPSLESSLAAFRTRYPEFSSRALTYIGLHATNLEQGEVFWDPNGYTILRGLEFVES